jgi:hypothetical protein
MKYTLYTLIVIILILGYFLAIPHIASNKTDGGEMNKVSGSRVENIESELVKAKTTVPEQGIVREVVVQEQKPTTVVPQVQTSTQGVYRNNSYKISFNHSSQSQVLEQLNYKAADPLVINLNPLQTKPLITVTDNIYPIPRMMKVTESKKVINNTEVTYSEYRNQVSDAQPAYIGYDYRLGNLSVLVSITLLPGVSNGIVAANDQAILEAEKIIASLARY